MRLAHLDAIHRVTQRSGVHVQEGGRHRSHAREVGSADGREGVGVERGARGAVQVAREGDAVGLHGAVGHHQPQRRAVGVVGEERAEEDVALVVEVHTPAGLGRVPPQGGVVERLRIGRVGLEHGRCIEGAGSRSA